jgi:hypothetical protein
MLWALGVLCYGSRGCGGSSGRLFSIDSNCNFSNIFRTIIFMFASGGGVLVADTGWA